MHSPCDAAVIGGGFFGCVLARELRRHVRRVVVLEKEDDLLQRASYANQARVHNGYHYPRSLRTAFRSRVNFPRFLADYADCVDRHFCKYYAIARHFSKVTAHYFEIFCRQIGAPLARAPASVRRLFDPDTVEEVFQVEECAFDAIKLKHRLRRELDEIGVEVRLNSTVLSVRPAPAAGLSVRYRNTEGTAELRAAQVFNCTYSQINQLLRASGLALLPFKHEWTEIALVEVPAPLRDLGITVMCGPFFSCMPFPARGLHSLSHVRYTPHLAWQDRADDPVESGPRPEWRSRPTHYPLMVRDAARYLPLLGQCRYCDSLWEVKTVLADSETSDSRPILFQQHAGLPHLHCIMGAKIDNVYDVMDEVRHFLFAARAAG
jgi:glycine/D-amino acid oxidase-like deaminating enzyme